MSWEHGLSLHSTKHTDTDAHSFYRHSSCQPYMYWEEAKVSLFSIDIYIFFLSRKRSVCTKMCANLTLPSSWSTKCVHWGLCLWSDQSNMRCPLSIGLNEYGTRGIFCLVEQKTGRRKCKWEILARELLNLEIFAVVVIASKYSTLERKVQMSLRTLTAVLFARTRHRINQDARDFPNLCWYI